MLDDLIDCSWFSLPQELGVAQGCWLFPLTRGPRAALSSPSCRRELHWWHASPLAQHLIVMVGYVTWPAVSCLRSFRILIWMPSGSDYLLASLLSGWFNISCAHPSSAQVELVPPTCLLHWAWKYPMSLAGKSEFTEFLSYGLVVPKASFAIEQPYQFPSSLSSFSGFKKLNSAWASFTKCFSILFFF